MGCVCACNVTRHCRYDARINLSLSLSPSGVHRAMGTHISKVRSVELDHQIWKPTLIQVYIVVMCLVIHDQL